MTNRDKILKYLRDIAPDSATNADLRRQVGIEPHQQVYVLTQELMRERQIHGRQDGKEWVFWYDAHSTTNEDSHSAIEVESSIKAFDDAALSEHKRTQRDNEVSQKAFDEYMKIALESSIEYAARLEQRTQQAVNFFLVVFTALIGAGALVLINVKPDVVMWSLEALVLVCMAGFGLLTYIWVTSSIVQTQQEGMLQYFLHKYFRDKDPYAFDRYGLSALLTWYNKAYDQQYSSWARNASKVSLLTLAVFTSAAVGGAAYAVWRAFWITQNLILPFLAVVLSCATMWAIWSMAERRISQIRADGLSIIAKYHDHFESENQEDADSVAHPA